MVKAAMTPTAIAKANRRMKALRERDAKRQEALKLQLEEWFDKFDTNKDGKFQREELRELLTFIMPDTPPTEENLDMLIEKATEVNTSSLKIKGNKDGTVTRQYLQATVMRYKDHLSQQRYLDRIFDEYDTDHNGAFDPQEVETLLKACAPEGVVVDATDVEYLISICDFNENGLIDRDELQPMLARWKVLAQDRAATLAEEEEAAAAEAARKAVRPSTLSFKKIGSKVRATNALVSPRTAAAGGSSSSDDAPAKPTRQPSYLGGMLTRKKSGGSKSFSGGQPSTPPMSPGTGISPESSAASQPRRPPAAAEAAAGEAAPTKGVEVVEVGGGCCKPGAAKVAAE